MFIANNWQDYEVLDCGSGEKLERWGDVYLRRPDPQAIWPARDPSLWRKAQAHYHRSEKGGGSWEFFDKLPERWEINYNCAGENLKFYVRPTGFKHTGLFPEQAANWDWMANLVKQRKAEGRDVKVLNLFAYTGAASLAARCAGADTTHLDSVRQVVTWAKGNMESSGLDNIRWVVEDALKFAKREAKRGNKYNGLIMDPPAYGHGPDGEKWKLDELLYEFLQEVAKILDPDDAFMVLNLYSNGYSAMLGDTAVRSAFGMLNGKGKGELTCGELLLKDNFGKAIPLSVFSRLVR